VKTWTISLILDLIAILGAGQARAHGDNEHQIAMVLKKQFEKPDAPLRVEPIVVEGDYSVAGWSQGARGGHAFLQSIGMKNDSAIRLANEPAQK
jgi:hypothetical protein